MNEELKQHATSFQEKVGDFWREYVALCERHGFVICDHEEPAMMVQHLSKLPKRHRPDMRSSRVVTQSAWKDGWTYSGDWHQVGEGDDLFADEPTETIQFQPQSATFKADGIRIESPGPIGAETKIWVDDVELGRVSKIVVTIEPTKELAVDVTFFAGWMPGMGA